MRDGLVAEVRNDQLPPDGAGHFGGHKRIDDNVAMVAANDAHDQEVVSKHLPDAVHDREQAVTMLSLALRHRLGLTVGGASLLSGPPLTKANC